MNTDPHDLRKSSIEDLQIEASAKAQRRKWMMEAAREIWEKQIMCADLTTEAMAAIMEKRYVKANGGK